MEPLDKKTCLRIKYSKLLAEADTQNLAAEDASIFGHLLAHPAYQNAESIFCYVSVKRETDTRAILFHALQAGKSVYTPRCLCSGIMEARRICSPEELSPARFGLLEPLADAPLALPDEIDLAIVPCLACDKKGYRLGYGGGYYDRWLAAFRGVSLCLCRASFLAGRLPSDNWDIPMDGLITGRGFLPCKGDTWPERNGNFFSP